MNPQTYRKTEGILYGYFKTKKRISLLKTKLSKINNRIDRIKLAIMDCNIELNDTLKAISYTNDRVTNRNISSTVENELLKAEKEFEIKFKKLFNELEEAQRNKRKTESKIRHLERKIEDIEVIFDTIDIETLEKDEVLKLIQFRYGERWSYLRIADYLHLAETTVRRKKDELLYYIAEKLRLI